MESFLPRELFAVFVDCHRRCSHDVVAVWRTVNWNLNQIVHHLQQLWFKPQPLIAEDQNSSTEELIFKQRDRAFYLLQSDQSIALLR